MTPLTVAAVLQEILDACVASFLLDDTPIVPGRAFITHGQPVWECEQLTVSLVNVQAARPFPLTQGRAVKSTVTPSMLVNIEIIRECWPAAEVSSPASARLPTPAALTAAANILANDASSLFSFLADGAAHGTLIPSIGTSADVALGQMTPLGPQGLFAGWRVPLTVKL